MVDIAFDHRAVDTHLTALFDLVVLGITDDLPADGVPGILRDRLDVFVESRFLKPLIGDADLAKALMSIGAVKGVEIGSGFEDAAKLGQEKGQYHQGDVFYGPESEGGIVFGIRDLPHRSFQ